MLSPLGTIPTISEKDAARLLISESALGEFAFDDALKVIAFMRPKRIKEGATFLREGDKSSTEFLILLLSGEVRAESKNSGSSEPVTLNVHGPGDLIGEVGMLTGGPRINTCIAITELAVAVLTRDALAKMMKNDPQLASRFLLSVASRLGERLRATTTKLKRFMQLNDVLHKEVYTLMDSQPIPKAKPTKAAREFESTEPLPLEAVRALKSGLAGQDAKALAKRLGRTKTDFADL
jgi:CRP/FNR family transcriptional regulator, cyclic AMP receptor protein